LNQRWHFGLEHAFAVGDVNSPEIGAAVDPHAIHICYPKFNIRDDRLSRQPGIRPN